MTHQPQLIPDQPTPEQAARDAERAEYLERLREKLKDPEFRAIEGFPIGEDEDILALSDPPYYTACPNPFLPEILERWQAERAQIREELGLPDDTDDNGDNARPVYHREPFAADVSEGKNDPIYNAHSYHTKVPHRAVMRYILHYTEPGDIVLDGFCGTGMTGVAAQLCGDHRSVESLGYQVREDGRLFDEQGQAFSQLGTRRAVLIDLSPAATFIAHSFNTLTDIRSLEHDANSLMLQVEDECGWMYETIHSDGETRGVAKYIIWSDVFLCPECGTEMVFWEVAIDPEEGRVLDEFHCPSCDAVASKRKLDRAIETVFNPNHGQTSRRAKQVPVLIIYEVGRQRFTKKPDASDCEIIQRCEQGLIPYRFPAARIDRDIDLWYERDYRSLGIYSVDAFFSRRNLWIASKMWNAISQLNSNALRFSMTGIMRDISRLTGVDVRKYFKGGGGPFAGGVKGTLYVPSLVVEKNVLFAFRNRVKRLKRAFSGLFRVPSIPVTTTQSTGNLAMIEPCSVDYIFTDPPFGENIIYSDLSIIWESWLGLYTNTKEEAVIHRRKKQNPSTLETYARLMTECFGQMYTALKPGRWMTVEFHNSQNRVWNAIQEAIMRSGFVVADVRTLDKKQKTFKQVTTAAAVKQDLVISAYKPRARFERRFLEQAGGVEGAWEFVRQHLTQLPVVVKQDGTLEVVAERQAYLLYDRMVAFHIQRGFSVPLGAAEFYAGLKQRFPDRDEMYFLPDQAAEYDRERMRATKVEQLALFVNDEKSAIQWLRRELDPEIGTGPQTYQDLQPKFLRELHQARHEDLPELSDMLAQNFLKDERERWYVPDPGRQGDLEKLRERSLLREFGEYAQGRGRLKVFRTEAVRAGFKHAWHERDYNLIVKVADRLPPSVLQEDASLLMYYDNALMRAEAQPEQGRLL